ncbi:MAG: extracellular solute-binding protein [Anaerolineales bacterium]|nr:extracellular solute-binding protein [Anaerolineales bacterium]
MRKWLLLCMVVVVVSSTPVLAQDPTATPTTPTTVRIWWPDALYPTAARPVIDDILGEYAQENGLDLRYFPYSTGNVVHRLDLTREVAPGAMPDLMLMRRDELTRAASSGLLEPIDGWVPISTSAGMSEDILAMGQYNQVLYGLPYMLEFQHMLYDPTQFEADTVTSEDILESHLPILFPAKPETGMVINDVLMIEYLAAGGSFVGSDGLPTLNEDAVRTVLDFFATGLEAGGFNSSLLQYTYPADYWDLITADSVSLVESQRFWQQRTSLDSKLTVFPILTPQGQPYLLVDGWVWVLIAQDEGARAEAQRFISWIMATDKLVDIADALQLIPSQQRAQRVLDDPYVEALTPLLTSSALVIQSPTNEAAAALQVAFEAVLNGGDPLEATAAALDSLTP